MRTTYVVGAGMLRFGKYPDLSMKELGRQAIDAALGDAGRDSGSLDVIFVANSMAGVLTGQESIRGQTILHSAGIGAVPVFNIENACASSSSALHLAWQAVGSGVYETAMVLGVEKLHHPDRAMTYRALSTAVDVELYPPDAGGSPFVKRSAKRAAEFLDELGANADVLARIAEKSHYHGSLNPLAQYQDTFSVQEILDSPGVGGPLTRLMCAPIGDGAAVLVLSSTTGRDDRPPVRLAGTAVGSARGVGQDAPRPMAREVADRAFRSAGRGPEDVDVVELHDTTAYNELRLYEDLGLFARDELVEAVETDQTRLGGRVVVNPSGGLVSRGHPVGASGAAQLVELTWQLRGSAGERQVEGARLGLAHNGGGWVGEDPAATAVTLLERDD